MKQSFNFVLAFVCASLFLASCSKEKTTCKTCSIIALGVETTTQVCEQSETLTVSVTALGITDTVAASGTLESYVEALEMAGHSCD